MYFLGQGLFSRMEMGLGQLFSQNRIGVGNTFYAEKMGGGQKLFAPKIKGFPGWCAGKFWPLTKKNKTSTLKSGIKGVLG